MSRYRRWNELLELLATGVLEQVILDIAFLGVDGIGAATLADAGVKVVTA